MANLSAQFNFKSAILTKDVYQALFRRNAGERELLVGRLDHNASDRRSKRPWLAAIMAISGQSVFQVMLRFNTLISLAYGPPALLGLVVAPNAASGPAWLRSPPGSSSVFWGAFVYHWSLIQQVAIIIPSSFGIFFVTMLFDRGRHAGHGRALFKNLDTPPVDVANEFEEIQPISTVPVFRLSEPDDSQLIGCCSAC